MIRIIKECPYPNHFCCDKCVERFEEIGFFFEEPGPQTQFSDRQTINLQIASVELQFETTTAVNHSRQFRIGSLPHSPNCISPSTMSFLRYRLKRQRMTASSRPCNSMKAKQRSRRKPSVQIRRT